MTQLHLPIVLDCDPRVQIAAARKLQRIVDERKRSFETIDFARRRKAALKSTRRT